MINDELKSVLNRTGFIHGWKVLESNMARYEIKGNGVLLNSDPEISDVSNALYTITQLTRENCMREKARGIWRELFNAEKNATDFADFICNQYDETIETILIVTDGYPFRDGERPFIENELVVLSERYDVIIIAIIDEAISKEMEIKANSRIKQIKRNIRCKHKLELYSYYDKLGMMLRAKGFISYIFDRRIKTEKQLVFNCNTNRISVFWESLKFYAKSMAFHKWFFSLFGDFDVSTMLIYTFWYRFPTLSFCLEGNKHVITRTHGYDLFDGRNKKSLRQPFKEVMDPLLDHVIFACNYSRDYYLKRYNFVEDIKKYKVMYLGTRKQDFGIENTHVDENVFRIVSCSNIISLKRIRLIIDGIRDLTPMLIDKKVEWIHFGDGPLRSEIEQYASNQLGDKVKYFFAGNVDNESIHEYYALNWVDCFITTSSSEGGVPVSIQEAMAYGIPIVGTNCGGISEAFN